MIYATRAMRRLAPDPKPGELVSKGDPNGPNIEQTALIDTSVQWLAHNFHTAPMPIPVFGKEGGEDFLGIPRNDIWGMHAMVPIGHRTADGGTPNRRPAEEDIFSKTWGQRVPRSVPQPLWTKD